MICSHCGKEFGEHKAKTRECPVGKRTRIGFIHYGPKTFCPARKRKSKKPLNSVTKTKKEHFDEQT